MPAASLPPGGHRRPLVARQLRFWVSVSILAMLFWFLADRLEREAERAERVGLKLMLNQLRAALVIKGAELRLARERNLSDWAGQNPMSLLLEPPPRYQGLCDEGEPKPGRWCFDSQNGVHGVLRYQPDQPLTIGEQQASEGDTLAWVVIAEYNDRNRNGTLDKDDRTTGLALVPATKRN